MRNSKIAALVVTSALCLSSTGAADEPVKATPDAAGQAAAPASGGGDSLAKVGAALSNPISDVWAMFTQFGLAFNDGDLNEGDPEVGFSIDFEPILPVPVYGPKEKEWRLIVRPSLPVFFGSPVPQGQNSFDQETGLGDTILPLPLAAPTGNLLFAVGPGFLLPTSTKDAFGRQQWAAGATGVFGYKNEKLTVGVFPQYYWGIGSRGDQDDTPDASFGELLYFSYWNLPDAWQVGFNPTITYDDKAANDNKWTVPVGLVVAKTTKIAGRPVKFQFGLEYSVVSPDAFGEQMLFKLNVIPVVESLVSKPILGGD